MAPTARSRRSVQFWALATFVFLTFLMGGGSRADVESLIVLRPIAVLLCGFALVTLTRQQVRRYRVQFGFAVGILLLVAVQLVPLPAAVWQGLPGRGVLAEVDRMVGLGAVWRPMTMAPDATWNALFSLFVPLAVLLLGMQISFDERMILVPLIIGLSILSGLVGLLQVVGSPDGPLYLYRITTTGSAVGLFANRNHAAVLLACTFPLLALFAWSEAAGRHFRGGAAAVIGLVLIPLLLVTGSRAGILLGVVGVGSAFALHMMRGNAARAGNRRRNALLLAAGLVSVVILFVAYSRAEAIQRLLAVRGDEDLRFQALGPILAMLWKYFPFGSGFGTFAPVFQIDEPYGLLMPTFLNHAHDDWLETVTDGGLPALVLLVLAVGCLAREAFRALQTPGRNSSRLMLARVGAIILVMLGISSLLDYPLRVPSLQCLAVIAIFWLGQRDRDAGPVR